MQKSLLIRVVKFMIITTEIANYQGYWEPRSAQAVVKVRRLTEIEMGVHLLGPEGAETGRAAHHTLMGLLSLLTAN